MTSVCKTLKYFLFLCFCFRDLDSFDQQTVWLVWIYSWIFFSTLFVIFTSSGIKLCVNSLHPKQYVVPGCFPVFVCFIFDCVFFIFCNLVKHFLTIHFKHFDFYIEVLIFFFLFPLLVLLFCLLFLFFFFVWFFL